MTDILLINTNDGGEICLDDLGGIEMTDDPRTAAYISLFGGNVDDDTRKKNTSSWWGNLDEGDEAAHLRSATQNLLATVPPTSDNLRRLEDAAARDLAWLGSADVSASVPALGRVLLRVRLSGYNYEFEEEWLA